MEPRALALSLSVVAACAHARPPAAAGAPDETVRIPAPAAATPTPPEAMPRATEPAPVVAEGGTILEERMLGGQAQVNGGPLALDNQGNLYVVGGFSGAARFGELAEMQSEGADAFVLKLDASLKPVWSRRIGGKSMESADDVAVDSSGGVYVSGTFSSPTLDLGKGPLRCAGIHDLFLAKYDRDGNLAWAKSYGDAQDQIDMRLRADPAGGVVATGWFNGAVDFGSGAVRSPFNKAAFVARIDPSGRGRWGKAFGHRLDYAGTDAIFGADGKLWVSGGSDGTAEFVAGGAPSAKNDLGPVLLAFDADGKRLSAKRFGSGADNMSTAIGLDARGGLRLVAGSRGTVDFGAGPRKPPPNEEAIHVASFDAAGALLWDRQVMTGSLASVSVARVSRGGETYVAGQVSELGKMGVGFLVKLSAAGEVVWSKKLDRSPLSWVSGLAFDARGRLLASGTVHATDDRASGRNALWVASIAP